MEIFLAMQNPNKTTLPTTIPRHSPLAFLLLTKHTGAVCNQDYKYCLFISKVLLYDSLLAILGIGVKFKRCQINHKKAMISQSSMS